MLAQMESCVIRVKVTIPLSSVFICMLMELNTLLQLQCDFRAENLMHAGKQVQPYSFLSNHNATSWQPFQTGIYEKKRKEKQYYNKYTLDFISKRNSKSSGMLLLLLLRSNMKPKSARFACL